MADREKVIKGLECCFDYYEAQCEKCPYQATEEEKKIVDWDCHHDDLQRDALELLKEQEPVKAVADGEDSYMCNNCGTVIGWAEWEPGGIEEVKYKFCPHCGRAVKWDEL